MKSKVVANAAEALAGLKSGMTVMSGGFGLCGNPEACIHHIAQSELKDLTIVSNNCGNQGRGLAALLKNRQVRKVICSFIGGNPDLSAQYLAGEVEVELNPQGTLAERIRAAGAGLGGFFTPTGVGTKVAEGKEVREINGRKYLFEKPLHADFALVRAHIGDKFGNLRFYKTSRNFNPLMATAAKVTVVEVDKLVEVGELDADDIHLPGLFVQHIFQADHENPIEHRTTRDQRGAAASPLNPPARGEQ